MMPRQGRIQGFPKGGVETRKWPQYEMRGGGVLSALDPTRKAGGGGGGGAARFRPDTKSRGRGCCPLQARYEKRGGGGGGGCCPFKARYEKRRGGGGGLLSGASGPILKAGKGEGLFSRRGGVTIYERGGCNPQNPPPPPPPPPVSASARGPLPPRWGSAVSSPIGVWGGAPEANAFHV